uniref:SRCR domain-containing protein n=1 Tax=Macrostomum lignano TaxID=282301 RepID=A0A1I8GLA8_9PLAT
SGRKSALSLVWCEQIGIAAQPQLAVLAGVQNRHLQDCHSPHFRTETLAGRTALSSVWCEQIGIGAELPAGHVEPGEAGIGIRLTFCNCIA